MKDIYFQPEYIPVYGIWFIRRLMFAKDYLDRGYHMQTRTSFNSLKPIVKLKQLEVN